MSLPLLAPDKAAAAIGLAERLGWRPGAIHARSCTLVVSPGGKQAGFLVAKVNDFVAIDQSPIQPWPDTGVARAGVVTGPVPASLRGDQGERSTMATLLDLDALAVTRQCAGA